MREAAHAFWQRFVAYLLAGGASVPEQVKQQYWYFADYDEDATIGSLLANYHWLTMVTIGDDYEPLTYEYLRDYVQFQYFDTNLSTQGEELYLSLNSTGHPTEDNENIRALLLEREPPADRARWGRQWEKWQDFFWQQCRATPNANPNANADPGFNEFLRWVWVIYLLEHDPPGATDLVEGKTKLGTVADANVRLTDVARAFTAVGYVAQTLTAAPQFFGNEWLAGGTGGRTQLTQLELLRWLPVLRYCLTRPAEPRPTTAMLHRLARYFYNISRRPSTIARNPAAYLLAAVRLAEGLATVSEDVTDLLNLPLTRTSQTPNLLPVEEQWKLDLYRQPPAGSQRADLEAQLWVLENDECNQGQVSHLFPEIVPDAPTAPAVERLAEVSRAYAKLFPIGQVAVREANQQLLQSLLLSYGPYWQVTTPWYYTNCVFDDWYETVRSPEFQEFFSSFTAADLSLAEFYQRRQQQYFAGKSVAQLQAVQSVPQQLFILAALFYELDAGVPISPDIWQRGHCIGYKSPEEDQNRYPFFTADICYLSSHRYPYRDAKSRRVVDYLAEAGGVDPASGVARLVSNLLARSFASGT